MKRILVLIIALLLVFSNLAFADIDYYYSGPIDYEGNPIGSISSSNYQEDENLIYLFNNLNYNSEKRLYCYTVDGIENAVCLNVMDGMIVQDEVEIEISNLLDVSIYKNGNLLKDATDVLAGIGNYSINYKVNGVEKRIVQFQIVGDYITDIERYEMPEYFIVDNVSFEGETIDEDVYTAYFKEEGYYTVYYHCYANNEFYTLNVALDKTPPSLGFIGIGSDAIAHGPVEIMELPEDVVGISVILNGVQIPYKKTLTEAGNYQVYVSDAAGNINQYVFTIQVYFNTSSKILIGLLLAVVLVVVIYILRSKRKMRMR